MIQPAVPTISEAGRAHLRWALTDGVGPIVFSRIVAEFGGAQAALGTSAGLLQRIRGISRDGADRILRSVASVDVDAEIGACEQHQVRILCRDDDEYPPGLARIPDPPIVLFVKGALRPTDAVAVAIVGSRRCTIYGSEQARRFGELLAGAGYTVVSGLARGIDAFAHHGAVDAGGRSIGVLGCGLDTVYPPENAALADKLLGSGALVSELPTRAPVRSTNFPSRNRIIAGMSLGTLVVEAADRSGALITARLAAEYNREVFAIPGRAQDPMSAGTNKLLRDGAAKLTLGLEDIVNELGEIGRAMATQRVADGAGDAANGQSPESAPRRRAAAAPDPLLPGLDHPAHAAMTPVERAVFEVIPFDAVLQDFVLRSIPFAPGEALAAITSLELKGMVRRLPGNLVSRAGRA